MKDMIDKRNFKEKCARSIVKGYNVHYVTKEELDAKKAMENAQNIPPDSDKKPVSEPAFVADERYAGVPSSQYGTTAVQDQATKEQIEKILGERKDDVFETMKELQ